jgi:hypothetical protein
LTADVDARTTYEVVGVDTELLVVQEAPASGRVQA